MKILRFEKFNINESGDNSIPLLNNKKIKDWIDDYAIGASKENLIIQRDELIKHKKEVENFEYKLAKINYYIKNCK